MTKQNTPRKKSAVAAGTREKILGAALHAFSDHGFDGAKTRDIADLAGVKLGLLQYHFGSKDKLWKAAVDRAFEDLHEGVAQLAETPDPAEVLQIFHELIEGYVRFAAHRPQFVRMMHEEGKRRGPRMRWLVDRHVRPLYERLSPLIRGAQQEGILLADIDPIHYMYAFAGAVGIIFHQAEECKRLSGADPSSEAIIDGHIRAMQHLFLRRG